VSEVATPSAGDGAVNRSMLTRLLHLVLALAVIHQLLISQVMQPPKSTTPGNLWFTAHATVGLITLAVLLAYWIWILVRRAEVAADRLFPWFSAAGRAAVLGDVVEHLHAFAAAPAANGGNPAIAKRRAWPGFAHRLGDGAHWSGIAAAGSSSEGGRGRSHRAQHSREPHVGLLGRARRSGAPARDSGRSRAAAHVAWRRRAGRAT
jgi:hypothetical protein